MRNFELSDEQTMILDTVRKFVQDLADPKALEHDEHRTFVRDNFTALAELGLLGLAVSEDSGGAGLGMVAFVVALEELGKGCGSTARLFLTQGGCCARALDGVEDAAAAELLEPVMTGEQVVGWVGGESAIRAEPVGDGFALHGRDDLVTGALEAQCFLVAAKDADREPGLFRVEADAVGREAVLALGFRAAAPGRVVFDGAAATALARGADAAAALDRARLAAWIGGAALAVGQATRSIELARAHSEERVAFGKPLARQQAVGHKLVESRRLTEGARHLTFHAAHLCDAGGAALDAARYARLSALEAAVRAADEAIQIHGGYGFTVEYHVERHYRDAQTLGVLDGGTDELRDALTASVGERS